MRRTLHEPQLTTAFYLAAGAARSGETALHRFLHDEFVEAYLADLDGGRLDAAAVRNWQAEDHFGRYHDHVTLRQPVHRTFYLASCEVVCATPGAPAFDPARIRSAGFVVRRREQDGSASAWTVSGGVPLGWRAATPGLDPDALRRRRTLFATLGVAPRTGAPARAARPARGEGSGESTHPLHVTTAYDTGGRRHTILYGFIPVGGGEARATPAAGAPASTVPLRDAERAALNEAVGLELGWPFGESGVVPRHDAAVVVMTNRAPTRPLRNLLRVLVERYRIGDPARSAENAELRAALATVPFRALPDAPGDLLGDALDTSLLDYLDAEHASAGRPLLLWLASQGAGPNAPAPALPSQHLPTRARRLVIDPIQGQVLRDLLVERHAAQVAELVDGRPVPRFGYEEDDVYELVPFVRYGDDDCEHVRYGPPSPPFRVAAPFEPEAARPTVIPLPRFSDLKRGVPKTGFLAPPDMARKLLGLKPDKGLDKDVAGDGDDLGLEWIISLSIPIVTICALILLMILVQILNMIFFWLPWVMVRIPVLKSQSRAPSSS